MSAGPAGAPAAAAGIHHPFATPPGPGKAVEIAAGILWMRLPLPMKLDHVNVYALDDDDGWTLVDTGFDSARSRALWQALVDGPLAGRAVRRVLVTHHHPDHVGLAGWFMARGAELIMTRTAWLMARMLCLDVQPSPPAGTLDFWRAAGMSPDLLAARAAERPFNFADCVHPLPPGYTRIAAGGRLRIGGRDWDVTAGHGHAPEHAVLWSGDGDLVIGGDQLLPGISPNLGVYPTEPQADPVGEWLDSCARLALLATPRQLVLPGHKLPFRGLPLRLSQMRDNHLGALDRVHQALSMRPLTAIGTFPALFRREIGMGEYGLALAEAVAHINRLNREGRAVPAGVDDHGGVLWRAAG
ncbi:MAG: MBL fold metallo-hydrolase [Paracoccus sp. (in: a-proteobacteria)]|nr:MBL fold metallo-hydrolase [Paracoccus sp. (in: a-proteobacteria)]